MRTDLELLVEALKKQHELLKKDYWASELLELSPPVLWFGDSNKKEKIVIVGANPSRREFLDKRNGKYFVGSNQRFYHLKTPHIQQILKSEETLKEIIESYDRYFHQNPYGVWFGKPGGSKVEGFHNGLGASLYGIEAIGAVHTDLIPFATMSGFSKLNERALNRDLFRNGWASNFFEKLMAFLNPSAIIMFGKTNAEYFNRYFHRIALNKSYKINGKKKEESQIWYF